ncbi:hypothetical protein EG68_07612 [Paragonimus skrjabini miyazakii]|uniref:Homeobox domain-containing protein n=1 Tax=Paragonimus skrjabini miyazakii TaxID=59628 RepID=A0A8S9YLQ8_9TREM|nr:hypothetical protein EG68_07612 [Paragonimus skrjabini miyazakii]
MNPWRNTNTVQQDCTNQPPASTAFCPSLPMSTYNLMKDLLLHFNQQVPVDSTSSMCPFVESWTSPLNETTMFHPYFQQSLLTYCMTKQPPVSQSIETSSVSGQTDFIQTNLTENANSTDHTGHHLNDASFPISFTHASRSPTQESRTEVERVHQVLESVGRSTGISEATNHEVAKDRVDYETSGTQINGIDCQSINSELHNDEETTDATKRYRTSYSQQQIKVLEKIYVTERYISRLQRSKLATELNLPENTIKTHKENSKWLPP